jgi:hypothetical protein
MLLIGSVMATFALKSIADIGRNMMQQAASKMASAKKAEGEQKGDESGSKRRKAEKAVKAGKAEPSKGSEKAAESGGNDKADRSNEGSESSGEISDREQKMLDNEKLHGSNWVKRTPKVTGNKISGYNPQTDQTYHDFLKEYMQKHTVKGSDALDKAKSWAEMMAKNKLVETGGESYNPIN